MSEKGSKIPKKLPWRIVVASNLTPDRESSGPYSVDKNSYNELTEKLAPSIFFTVKNTMGVEVKHLDVDLKIKSIKDFTPDSIAEKVPALASLLTLREMFKKYCNGEIKQEELQTFLSGKPTPSRLEPFFEGLTGKSQASPETTVKADEKKSESKDSKGNLDTIMNIMDLCIKEEEKKDIAAPQKPIEGLFESVGERYTVKASLKDLDAVTQTVDEILEEQVEEIIHAPMFIEFETAWRELKFLIDRTNFREGVKIDVIACEKGELDKTLTEKVFNPVWNNDTIAPDLIVSTHALSQSVVDEELAGNLAKLGQSTQTVILTWAGPKFFNIENFADLPSSVPSISMQLNGTGYEKWRSLREKNEPDWLVIATNGFYLRDTYGPEGIRSKTFQYKESDDYENLPNGAGSIAVASILSEMFSLLGTDELLESKPRPELDNLPIVSVTRDNKTVSLTCTLSLTNDQVYDITDSGLIPINCQPNDYRLYMESTCTYIKESVSLSTMVMAGHISRVAVDIAQKNKNVQEKEVESIIYAALKKMLFDKVDRVVAKDTINVKVVMNTEGDGERLYELSINMPYKLLGDDVTIRTSFSM